MFLADNFDRKSTFLRTNFLSDHVSCGQFWSEIEFLADKFSLRSSFLRTNFDSDRVSCGQFFSCGKFFFFLTRNGFFLREIFFFSYSKWVFLAGKFFFLLLEMGFSCGKSFFFSYSKWVFLAGNFFTQLTLSSMRSGYFSIVCNPLLGGLVLISRLPLGFQVDNYPLSPCLRGPGTQHTLSQTGSGYSTSLSKPFFGVRVLF